MKQSGYTGTRNIYGDMETAAKSLVANSDVDRVVLFIEDDEFPNELPDIVETRNVSGQEHFPQGGPNMSTQYSYMALMRAAVCKEVDGDRALVLDTDTVSVRDVSDIWDLDMEGCYIAATPEWHRSKNGLMYCNCGVVLQDLEKLREWKADEIIDALNRRYFRWVDQDMFNYLCQGHIAEMPYEYNANHWTRNGFFDMLPRARMREARIVHYAGMREFRKHEEYSIYSNMGWDEAMERHGRTVYRHSGIR